jgi:CSLREA domain-containing protein
MKTQDSRDHAKYPRKCLAVILILLCLVFVSGSHPQRADAYAYTFVVNSFDDENDMFWGDGACDTLSPAGECTLRAALDEIYGLYLGYDLPVDKGTFTITVPAGTYNLTLGSLGVGGNIIINGAGRDATFIDGQDSYRVMGVGAPVVPDVVTIQINNLEVRNGHDGSGGGLLIIDGNVTLNNVDIVENYADVSSGGGIVNWGQLTLNHVVFSGNRAEQNGGAIFNQSTGVVQVMDSTFYRNKSLDVTGLNDGGAIYNSSGASLVVQRSTFEGNNAPSGGGLFNNGSAQLTNVTFYANKGTTSGGAGGAAIYNNSPGQLWLWNVTIANNESTIPAALTNSGNIQVMAHTIVANNTGGDCNDTGTVNPLNEHHNLSSDTSCSTVMTNESDQTNTDPKLLPLAVNGGPTETVALAADSPAIDAGDPLGCKSYGLPLTTDQRGWPRTVDGDVDGTAVCDIGAFEAPPPYQLWLPLIMR